jgi:hypothetical protein
MPQLLVSCSLRACGKIVETPHKLNPLRAFPQTLGIVVFLGLPAISVLGVDAARIRRSLKPRIPYHLLTRHRHEELISMRSTFSPPSPN